MSFHEDDITKWFAAQRKPDLSRFPIGIGDDMAMLTAGKSNSLLITTDMLLDSTHFDLADSGPEKAGYKAIAASLSDCAAMATKPLCAVAAVALPRNSDPELLKDLYKGMLRAADMFNCSIIGGDITSWQGRLAINVTMLSEPANHRPVRRNTASDTNAICVTGSLGGSYPDKHLNFTPRVNEALRLAELADIRAMMDISDGLSTDLNRICTASGVGAIVESEKIPLSPQAQQTDNAIQSALNDGEDFELLFAIDQDQLAQLMQKWDMSTPIAQIGRFTSQPQILLQTPDGRREKLTPKGYDHLD